MKLYILYVNFHTGLKNMSCFEYLEIRWRYQSENANLTIQIKKKPESFIGEKNITEMKLILIIFNSSNKENYYYNYIYTYSYKRLRFTVFIQDFILKIKKANFAAVGLNRFKSFIHSYSINVLSITKCKHHSKISNSCPNAYPDNYFNLNINRGEYKLQFNAFLGKEMQSFEQKRAQTSEC